MFSIKNTIVYILFFNILAQSYGLVELPDIEFNEIVSTEAGIRLTVNKLFSSLKLRGGKRKEKFKEFASIHNLFVAITLQDQHYLKEIGKHAKAENYDNSTQSFIALINEILTEDKKSDETTDDVYVTTHIQAFIKRLEDLKAKYGFTNNASKYDNINAEILKHLDANKINFMNITDDYKDSNETEDNNVLTDDDLWRPTEASGRRIYMGRTVAIKRYPFVASVQFFKKFQCAGSIIKDDLVITAASCLQLAWNNRFFRENPSFLSVQVGCSFYQNCEENIPVIEVYFHPEYDPKTLRNNLALMRLVRILKLGKRVKLVKRIDFDRNANPLPTNAGRITILGWGARSPANIMRSPWYDRLAVAELDQYPLRECQEIYTKEYVSRKNFCAGFFSKGGGACNRDVGGPGVQSSKLLGVVSFGSPACGGLDAPTVFTKLGYYADWIDEIMDQSVPRHNMMTTERTTRDFKSQFNMYTQKTTKYRIVPVTGASKKEKEEPQKKEEEALRTIAESAVFKQFLETMFSSNEVANYMKERLEDEPQPQEYLPEKSDETEGFAPARKEQNIKIKPTAEAIALQSDEMFGTIPPYSVTRETYQQQIKPSIEAPPAPAAFNIAPINYVEEERRVTKIEDFDATDNYKLFEHKQKTKPFHYYPSGKRQTAIMDDAILESQRQDIGDGQDFKDVQIKEAIDKLVNDLNIEVVTKKQYEDARQGKKETVYTAESSGSTEDSLDSEGNDIAKSSVSISTSSEDTSEVDINVVPHQDRKTIDQGLSIPANGFNDLTFRHNTTGILSILTNDELINLLSEAVAESHFLKTEP